VKPGHKKFILVAHDWGGAIAWAFGVRADASAQRVHRQGPDARDLGREDAALLIGSLDGLERFVPQLTIKRIPDGTHWVIHEKPELVNKYIREFIKF
jgi:pimeloyl-ACP methyl ester carboxylesterase